MVANKVIMTPKQKAEDLYNTYVDYTQGDYNCKQCALIAAEELYKETSNNHFIIGRNGRSGKEYWEEVKKEIEKL
jgi:hypothetical protein